MYNLQCPICGLDFTDCNSNRKYCSRKCYFESRKKSILKTCSHCGISFESKYSSTKYCTVCRIGVRRRHLVCINCGKVFSTVSNNCSCCSRKCAREYRNRNNIKPCIQCGKLFVPQKIAGKYCSSECAHDGMKRRKNVACKWCGNQLEVIFSSKKEFCCRRHVGLYFSHKRNKVEDSGVEIENITWSRKLSYILGIITADGTLRRDRKLIKISSNDIDMLNEIRDFVGDFITKRKNPIHTNERVMHGKTFTNYTYAFTSEVLYDFCIEVGIVPNKTLILGELAIPEDFFSDFLRGVIDGDGNFNIIKRCYTNQVTHYINIRITSGSLKFLEWVNSTCKKILDIDGSIIREQSKANCYTLFWSKGIVCNRIIQYIYTNCDLYLDRKWIKLQKSKPFLNSDNWFLITNDNPISVT